MASYFVYLKCIKMRHRLEDSEPVAIPTQMQPSGPALAPFFQQFPWNGHTGAGGVMVA